MTFALPLACAVGVVVMLIGEGTGTFALRVIGKTVASLSFLAWGVQLGLPRAGASGVAMTVALVFSVIGDLALLGHSKAMFLAGLGSFLLGHVAFAVAFFLLGPWWGIVAASALPILLGAALVWRWVGPHTGRLAVPVMAYMAAITVMVSFAYGVGLTGDSVRIGLPVGATMFWASDLFVARQRFVAQTPVNRYVGIPLYYAAQLVLIWTAALA
jgi:uncharacterized membrane protein YhhN